MERLLQADETYRCLLTVPGIGPRTAAEPADSVDMAEFRGHDRLASYRGPAPRNGQSGTSIPSVTASGQGNRRLKNLPIFSCTPPSPLGRPVIIRYPEAGPKDH